MLRPLATDAPLPNTLRRAHQPAAYYQSYTAAGRSLDRGTRNVDAVIAAASSSNAEAARSDVFVYGGVAVLRCS